MKNFRQESQWRTFFNDEKKAIYSMMKLLVHLQKWSPGEKTYNNHSPMCAILIIALNPSYYVLIDYHS